MLSEGIDVGPSPATHTRIHSSGTIFIESLKEVDSRTMLSLPYNGSSIAMATAKPFKRLLGVFLRYTPSIQGSSGRCSRRNLTILALKPSKNLSMAPRSAEAFWFRMARSEKCRKQYWDLCSKSSNTQICQAWKCISWDSLRWCQKMARPLISSLCFVILYVRYPACTACILQRSSANSRCFNRV